MATALSAEVNNNNWILDTGATNHLVGNKNLYKSSQPADQSIGMANGELIRATRIGTAVIKNQCSGDLEMREALFAPSVKMNLLSIKRATDAGHKAIFRKNSAEIVNSSGKVLIRAKQINGLWQTDGANDRKVCALSSKSENSIELWHRRLGHLNHSAIYKMAKDELVKGIEKFPNKNAKSCAVCVRNKIREESHAKEAENRASEILERIHSDVCGPMPTTAIKGERYFVTFIDEKSRYLKVYPIKSRESVGEVFEEFKHFVENQTGKRIKCVRTDNGAEYKGGKFASVIKSSGIKHELTVPGSPHQNGMAERMNLTLINQVKCMLEEAGLPYDLWAEALHTACYLRNRSESRVVANKTPFEAFWGIKPNIGHLKVFGARAIAIDKIITRRKFDARGRDCRMIGYSSHHKGYRMLDDQSRKIFISRTVKFFDEGVVQDDVVNFPDDIVDEIRPRRNAPRAVKDVRPIPDLKSHYEKKKAASLKRQDSAKKQSEEQNEDNEEEADQLVSELKLSDEDGETPTSYEEATSGKWTKFW